MMPITSIIVATARSGAIGRGGDLLFHLRDDLRRFKELTMGKPMIMGRRTFESLPGGALPGRRNIVITSSADFSADGAEVARRLSDAMEMAGNVPEIMIIGGGQVYEKAIWFADRIYLTEIDADVTDADTFFPAIDPERWLTMDSSEWLTDPKTGVRFRFVTLERRLGE